MTAVGIEHQDTLTAAAAAGTTHELPVARLRPLQIDPDVGVLADRCALTVIDRGGGFDATMVGDQRDDDAEHGRGLTLMRALVDNVDFVDKPQVGAVVHMVKALSYDHAHPLHRERTG